ncbi:hypothetical protein EV368DRAFT_80014 [Lentinula lateritia]|nr:hypothetical protein EV368DRAFT_80014 [Lentinula lateritia]
MSTFGVNIDFSNHYYALDTETNTTCHWDAEEGEPAPSTRVVSQSVRDGVTKRSNGAGGRAERRSKR